jgi:trans-aconitate 2-methyltransferase
VERTRPVRDLVACITIHEVRCAPDIGCGAGNSTQIQRERSPEALIVGLVSSGDIIEATRTALLPFPSPFFVATRSS